MAKGSSSDSMDRIEESGEAFYGPPGENRASRGKSKDGDESVKMATALGMNLGGWMEELDEGCENPYPITSAALKAKNTRRNNDDYE